MDPKLKKIFFKFLLKNFLYQYKRNDMNGLKEFDFVVFHTPMSEQEKTEIYLVVDELADDEDVRSLKVMEIHQKLTIPCVNTFHKSDFKLHYRPTESEIEQIKSGKKVTPAI
jgi:hypothetical protein